MLKKLEEKFKSVAGISEDTAVLSRQNLSESALYKQQLAMGFEFTKELRELYQEADGTSIGPSGDPYPLFFTHIFNPIDTVITIHQDLVSLSKTAHAAEYEETRQGNLYKDYYFNHKLGAIQHLEFHAHWFPLGGIGGMSTYIMVDHAPGPSGVYGQVIYINLGRKAIVLADSIEQYFEKLIKHAKYANKQEDDYKVMLRLATDSIWRSMRL